MSNMSYCRFQNTLNDLRDCFDAWDDVKDDNEEEKTAQDRLLKLCKRIVENYADED